MANDYVTLADLKTALPNLSSTLEDGSQDALLTSLITRAGRAIDRWTGRKPGAYKVATDGSEDVTAYYDAPGGTGWLFGPKFDRIGGSVHNSALQLWLDSGEDEPELAGPPTSVAMSVDGKVTSYVALVATDYLLWPYNALSSGKPYQRIDLDPINGHYLTWYGFRKGVKIVGPFGYSSTPPDDVVQGVIMQSGRWYKRAENAYQDKMELIGVGMIEAYTDRLDTDIEKLVAHLRRQAI